MTPPRSSATSSEHEISAGGVVVRGEQTIVIVPTRRGAQGQRVLGLPKGHVDPGETPEQAAAREVREEAGVEIGPPEYVASQPWPFPTSLMLGFTAPWRGGEPRRIDAELEDVRWFERAEVAAAVAGRDSPLGLPPRFAIARRLLEHWLQR
jgi:NADH pyrophosphatase NudC (nudix superfamily)